MGSWITSYASISDDPQRVIIQVKDMMDLSTMY